MAVDLHAYTVQSIHHVQQIEFNKWIPTRNLCRFCGENRPIFNMDDFIYRQTFHSWALGFRKSLMIHVHAFQLCPCFLEDSTFEAVRCHLPYLKSQIYVNQRATES